MRAIALVLAAVALAGCGEAFFGMCGPHDSVHWRDADLYEALGQVEHATVPTTPGLVGSAEVGLPGGVVSTLHWSPGGQLGREVARVSLGGGTLGAQAATDDEARSLLRSFLANATTRDAEPVVDAALANKTKALEMVRGEGPVTVLWSYAASVEGPWELGNITALAREGAARAEHMEPGTARLDADGYSFVVSYPVRTATLEGIPLTVDAAGQAKAVPGERPDDAGENDALDRVRAALRAHGLPEPESPRVATVVC